MGRSEAPSENEREYRRRSVSKVHGSTGGAERMTSSFNTLGPNEYRRDAGTPSTRSAYDADESSLFSGSEETERRGGPSPPPLPGSGRAPLAGERAVRRREPSGGEKFRGASPPHA